MPGDKLSGNAASGRILKIICIAGILLLIIAGGCLAVFALMGIKSAKPEQDAAFSRLLFEFDRELFQHISPNDGGSGVTRIFISDQEIEKLQNMLDRMEEKAIGAESLLSVLKRRRQIIQYSPQRVESYRLAAERARRAYPHSENVAAIAAAALVQGKALTPETEQALRECLPNLSSSRTASLRLSLHVLLGDLQNPQKATAALGVTSAPVVASAPGAWFSSSAVPHSLADREAMIINSALINILRSNSAPAEMAELLAGYDPSNANASNDDSSNADPHNDEASGAEARNDDSNNAEASNEGTMPSIRALKFAADYYYDFGDPLTAAELFAHIPEESALARQADALWLAGYPDAARNIWNVLASQQTGYQEHALYNLALSEDDRDAAMSHLSGLAALPRSGQDPSREFGVIRYSRFLNAAQATALLEAEIAAANSAANFAPSLTAPPPIKQQYSAQSIKALLELELLRRRQELWDGGRITGAAWLLLGRFPDEENIYQWINWYFIYQRNYDETAQLIKHGERHDIRFPMSEAVLYIHESDYDKAEQSLLPLASGENASWEAQANLARILEARRAPARAVEYYEKAAAAVSDAADASRIQFRIAQCLKNLGRYADVRRVLEYALDLNPDNINARSELNRMP